VLTSSLTLLLMGIFMGPGGVFLSAPAPACVAVIVAGSAMVVIGVTVGFVPIRWTELAIGGLKGTVETPDQEFRSFYREHRDRLQRFATLICGDRREASDLLREASARAAGVDDRRLGRPTSGDPAEPALGAARAAPDPGRAPGLLRAGDAVTRAPAANSATLVWRM
jgi:hypothetical protein